MAAFVGMRAASNGTPRRCDASASASASARASHAILRRRPPDSRRHRPWRFTPTSGMFVSITRISTRRTFGVATLDEVASSVARGFRVALQVAITVSTPDISVITME